MANESWIEFSLIPNLYSKSGSYASGFWTLLWVNKSPGDVVKCRSRFSGLEMGHMLPGNADVQTTHWVAWICSPFLQLCLSRSVYGPDWPSVDRCPAQQEEGGRVPFLQSPHHSFQAWYPSHLLHHLLSFICLICACSDSWPHCPVSHHPSSTTSAHLACESQLTLEH